MFKRYCGPTLVCVLKECPMPVVCILEDLGWSFGSCGRALYVCMKTQFVRPAISKIRAVCPNLVAVATVLSHSLSSYFFKVF